MQQRINSCVVNTEKAGNCKRCEILNVGFGRDVPRWHSRAFDRQLARKIAGRKVVEDLVCFSDLFPTLVEAAGLPPKKITNADGWNFWPQCEGKAGRKRDWSYGYYFPRPSSVKYNDKYSHYEVRFARDKRFKLYDNGEMFDTIDDVLEKRPIAIGKAGPPGMSARKVLQQALDSYPNAGRNANRRKQAAKKDETLGGLLDFAANAVVVSRRKV